MTASFIVLVQLSESTRLFMSTTSAGLGITVAACIFSIVFLYAIICCFRKKHPTNMYLLFGFTACETWMVGGLTAFYSSNIVILAGLATALTTIALTVYAMRTK